MVEAFPVPAARPRYLPLPMARPATEALRRVEGAGGRSVARAAGGGERERDLRARLIGGSALTGAAGIVDQRRAVREDRR